LRVCIAPSNILNYPKGGGHAWCFLNWALGLRAVGCEVAWALPSFQDCWPARERLEQLRDFHDLCERIGLHSRTALIPDEEIESDPPDLTVPFAEVAEESDLLLSFEYTLSPRIVSRFKRTALVDIDPGLLHLWIAQGLIAPSRYDAYFTIGETVGSPDALFSDCGLEWLYTPPPVCLSTWQPAGASETAPYTSVSGWWGEWLQLDGQLIDNSKRSSFLEYLHIPSEAAAALELALCLGENDSAERKSLKDNGWSVKTAWGISADEYRSYVLRSRGEFSCAKPSCMRLQNAWVSDRTICYLAAGTSRRPSSRANSLN
jgi:hypothetical protein